MVDRLSQWLRSCGSEKSNGVLVPNNNMQYASDVYILSCNGWSVAMVAELIIRNQMGLQIIICKTHRMLIDWVAPRLQWLIGCNGWGAAAVRNQMGLQTTICNTHQILMYWVAPQLQWLIDCNGWVAAAAKSQLGLQIIMCNTHRMSIYWVAPCNRWSVAMVEGAPSVRHQMGLQITKCNTHRMSIHWVCLLYTSPSPRD